jgi:hypothetical protein
MIPPLSAGYETSKRIRRNYPVQRGGIFQKTAYKPHPRWAFAAIESLA